MSLRKLPPVAAAFCLTAFLSTSPAFAAGSSSFNQTCHGVGLTFGITGISSDADGVVVTGIAVNNTPVQFDATTTGNLGTTDTVMFDYQEKHYELKVSDLDYEPVISAMVTGAPDPEWLHCEE